MTQATFHCDCAAGPNIRSIRLSVVKLDPPYGAVQARGAPQSPWMRLERMAKPVDVAAPTPYVEVELLDQTRSCTLACIGWTGSDGTLHSCPGIREMTLKQGDSQFRPQPSAPRMPRPV